MLLILVLLFSVLFLLWKLANRAFEIFDDAGVPYLKPSSLPVATWKMIGRTEFFVDMVEKVYSKVGDRNCRYVGTFSLHLPVIMVRNLEMIKQITVKDFDHFSEHKNGISSDSEPLLGKSLISLKGQKWRDMRASLSPAFTSSKIRDMIPFVMECGDQMIDYLGELCDENLRNKGEASADIEGKDFCSRYMTDVIATSAFGTRVDSFKNKTNEFFLMGRCFTDFGLSFLLRMMAVVIAPNLTKLVGIRLFDDKINHFFRDLVLNMMKYRKENGIVRRDMIQLLMELKQGSLKHDNTGNTPQNDAGFATVEESEIGKKVHKQSWSDDDLVGQAVLFFFAGFETASTVSSFLLHELAVNPDVQDKLRQEVDEVIENHGLNINYDTIQGMKYLDMFISEGLRKWPPVIVGDRACVKNIDLGPVREGERTSYTIREGDVLWIPTYSIHHDPMYWEDPNKFDPERFSDENKHKILPFSYLPFGSGPRNCIGSRFALMEAKIMVMRIISKFNIQESSKTKNPIVLDQKKFTLQADGGFWVKFVKRSI